MQQVVIAKPYEFAPPHHGALWPWLMQKWLPGHTRRKWGIEGLEFHGLERLQASLKAGHGVILAPNHCRPCDALILALLGAELRQPFYTMAVAHLFMKSQHSALAPLFHGGPSASSSRRPRSRSTQNRFLHPGGCSQAACDISRGCDHSWERPSGFNVMDGVAFLFAVRCRTRAKVEPAGHVVIHPIALRYTFCGDLRQSIELILDMIEKRLAGGPISVPALSSGRAGSARPF